MLLKDILSVKGNKVWTVRADQTVHEALEILVTHRIGALIVFGAQNEIAGILSERDIMRECYHNNKGWESQAVSKIMTKNLVVGTPDDSVDYVMGIMTQNRVRHVPVIKDKKLEGIVSIGDVVKAQLKDSQYENRYLKEYLYGHNTSTE